MSVRTTTRTHSSLPAFLLMLCCAASSFAVETYVFPRSWQGTREGETTGNPIVQNGAPLWEAMQVWPAEDVYDVASYVRMVWANHEGWMAPEHEQGNQPSISIRQGALHLSSRGPSKAKPGYKVPALVFIAPKAGVYTIGATISARIWEGQPAPTIFVVVKLDQQGFGRLLGKALVLEPGASEELERKGVKLAEGDRLALVAKVMHHDMAGTAMLKDLKVIRTGDLDKNAMPFGKPVATYRPPRGWHGTKKGETDGNAVAAVAEKDEGEWRLERLYPGDPRDPELYALLPWSGKRWEATDQAFGGQPCVDVAGTRITLGARGPWPGKPGDKIPVLTFVATKPGVYQLRGTAKAKIWESPQKPILLRILSTDVDGMLAIAGECTIAHGQTAELDELVVELPPQGRISIMAVPTGGNQAANVDLSGFAILRH